MVDNPMKMEKVSSRKFSQSCNDTDEKNLGYYCEIAKQSIGCYNLKQLNDVKRFFMECNNKNTANRWYPEYIKILKELSNLSDQNPEPLEECMHLFIDRIIPKVTDLNSLYENINSYGLENPNIIQTINEFKVCDRILKNHDRLSKRFNISNYIHERRRAPIDELVYEVCNMVDTYDAIPGYGKMNIALGEMVYLLSENTIDYDQKEFLESLIDYFLSRETNRDSDISVGYSRVLKESNLIPNITLAPIQFLFECENYQTNNDVCGTINAYKLLSEKSDDKFLTTLENVLVDDMQVLKECSNILSWVKNFLVMSTDNINNITESMNMIRNCYMEMGLNRKYTDILIRDLQTERKKISGRMIRSTNEGTLPNLDTYLKGLDNTIFAVQGYKQDLYTDTEAIKHYQMEKLSKEILSFQEFKIFKFHNLINLTHQVNKMIERTYKKVSTATKAVITKMKDVITESNISSYITEDNKIDFCVAEFNTKAVEDLNNFHEYMTKYCADLQNNTNSNSIFYYVMNEDTCEIRIRELYEVILENESEYGFSDMDMYRCSELLSYAEAFETLDKIGFSNIMEDIESKMDYITPDQINIFLDLWSYSNIISTEEMGKFIDTYCDIKTKEFCPSDAHKVKFKYEHLEFEPVYDMDIIVESAKMMQEVISISEAVDLNNIKLAVQAMKKKVKDMGAKEKELSRDLDSSINNLVRGARSFFVSDRREAIIKGSIVPSFSKIMKIGIGLWAIAVPFNQPVLAAIAIIGGLAASKNLTAKERGLLLDELDIELQVVEREIKKAEDQGKSQRKYRALLTYQKSLLRERQRIKYNLNISGKRLPNASLKGDD